MMSKANRRYLRSVLMLVAAMGGLVWAAVDLFEIPFEEMRTLFVGVALGAGAIIILAAVFLLLAGLIRRLLSQTRK